MTDILFIIPPQWSPFQPPLSIPSLDAWIKKEGHCSQCIDINILFYEWLLSDECLDIISKLLNNRKLKKWKKEAYTIFLKNNFANVKKSISHLQHVNNKDENLSKNELIESNYMSIKHMESYLKIVSEISMYFEISPYEFSFKNVNNLDPLTLEAFVDTPPPIIKEFSQYILGKINGFKEFSSIGISCIGQEQLYFTLLLSKHLKNQFGVPVIIGGTIFSRIFERGILPIRWFGSYFDVIVRNEGEKPLTKLLNNIKSSDPLTKGIRGIIFKSENQIITTLPEAPLKSIELPIPDFDNLQLDKYFSYNITLPILSSRGCYWGKCEFCHHGMVYGEKYGVYEVESVLNSIKFLSEKYNVNHFAFNDEAIPPKIIRRIGETFPDSETSKWNFTGLIKFEKFFTKSDFKNIYKKGFKSLYVGLESASERVLQLMKKSTQKAVFTKNLKDATEAGIWMHTFLFFGFPGETESEAKETYDFIMNNADIISSFGGGTFALEHNSPIFSHLDEYGIAIDERLDKDLNVYYDYNVKSGISPERALYWMNKLNSDSLKINKYYAANWVAREHLLCLLSVLSSEELVNLGAQIRNFGGLPLGQNLNEFTSIGQLNGSTLFLNNLNLKLVKTNNNTAKLLELFYSNDYTTEEIYKLFSPLLTKIKNSNSTNMTFEFIT